MDAADPTAELITTFNELNASAVDELGEEPSPLEFMRYVARNTPFVARGAAGDWPAVQKWSAAYLGQALRGLSVNVAVTPDGNADAPTPDDAGELVFAKPHEEDQSFGAFLEYLTEQGGCPATSEVRYAQTQNDNLRHEYVSLFGEVRPSIPFARIALQKDPDAINLWVGNARSVTALHRDNYENVYVQIRGRKHFVLLPALCQPCVNEQDLSPTHYARPPGGGADGLVLVREDGAEREENGGANGRVPFATWDPDRPQVRATKYSHLARPVRVTLDPGDMLYLPAMWYHKVSQSCADDGICVAANYWYDMDFGGPLYALCSYVRNGHRSVSG